MRVVEGTEGYLTVPYTYMGRHYKAFQSLESELKYEKPSSMSCLIIGPGIAAASEIDIRCINTFQPFELANVLIKSNILDYQIDIIDINKSVLEEFKKRPARIKIPIVRKDLEINKYRYFESIFPKNTTVTSLDYRIANIPESVTSKFNLQLIDIIEDNLPKEKYDVVVCTVLLSHYYRKVTGRDNNPVPETLKKIENSVKHGGYFIDTEKSPKDPDWQDIMINTDKRIVSGHNDAASLFRKK